MECRWIIGVGFGVPARAHQPGKGQHVLFLELNKRYSSRTGNQLNPMEKQ